MAVMMPEYLYRRNTVLETLQANRRDLGCLWLQKGARQTHDIATRARKLGVRVATADKQELSRMAGSSSHQGTVLEVGPYPYSDMDDMLELADHRGERPFFLLLDLLHGPQNIGALLRAAEACGVHGIFLQDRRAPEITPHVVIYSAGAAEHLLIAQVTNLVQTMHLLKKADIWIVGLDIGQEAIPLGQLDLNMALALVVGHEGSGLRRLVRKNCDLLLELPMKGRVASLNAASAGAIVLYAAWQARGFEGAT
jgi:23S rRNA (guanosine2251-2'-O)-methyltransferase